MGELVKAGQEEVRGGPLQEHLPTEGSGEVKRDFTTKVVDDLLNNSFAESMFNGTPPRMLVMSLSGHISIQSRTACL